MATPRRSSTPATRARRNPSSTQTMAARPSSLARARTAPGRRATAAPAGPLEEFRQAVRLFPVSFVVASGMAGYLLGHFIARSVAPSTSTSIIY